MGITGNQTPGIPPEQQAIRNRCFHPSGKFTEFRKEDIEQSIPERFEDQVRKYTDRLAVKTKTGELTYDQLNRAANRAAHAILQRRGGGAEAIALFLEYDSPFFGAILGVLKAGKYFLTLDPAMPSERITFMLEDSQAGLIITNNQNLSSARDLIRDDFPLINVDELNPDLFDCDNPSLPILPQALAMISYTSGSTGEPKGITRRHLGALYNAMASANILHYCEEDKLIALRSMSTAAATNDIFAMLLTGGACYPFDIKKEGLPPLAQWMIQQRITIFNCVATTYRHFVETISDLRLPDLRLLYVGGESVRKMDVDLYQKHFVDTCLFVNRLGSGETTEVCCNLIDKNTTLSGNRVPVGYPRDGTSVLLLDDAGEEVGLGQTGEIAIKSRYLAPGYWRNPKLTQAKFLPDPDGGDERIYLTGDLGRLDADGCLEHLGRNDSQVKIRGFRVELAGIEELLLGLAAVKEAAVIARENAQGDQALAAYLVPSGKLAPDVGEIRRELAAKLPAYMIPSTITILDVLPLTGSGKVDLKALPEVDRNRPELGNPYSHPRTPIEEEVVNIWCQVLNLDSVGIDDNFLELGGDSLLASRVISRLIQALQIEVSPSALLESSTVADMALPIVQSQAMKANRKEIDLLLTGLEGQSD